MAFFSDGKESKMELSEKKARLQAYFRAHPKVLLGFSGGVDSAFLLASAKEMGAEAVACFVKTPFQPQFELEDARRLADGVGISLHIIPGNPLSDPQVVRNDARRCYYCKQMIFSALRAYADRIGAVLIDGTNATDPEDDRPGMQALRELSVESPLRLCGWGKADIRAESRRMGLFTWDKPSYACLATRIPTGTPIDAETLRKVEGAEDALFALGLQDFRVRVFHGAARLQLPEKEWHIGEELRRDICERVGQYFDTVLLDMTPRQPRE